MKVKNKYKVYGSKEHDYLRFSLIVFPLFCFYLAIEIQFLWLYTVACIVLIMDCLILSYINAKVILTEQGLFLRFGLFKSYQLKWDEIVCCGVFSPRIIGSYSTVKYVFFSRKTINPKQLSAHNTLPKHSSDFLFFYYDRNAVALVNQLWDNKMLKNIG